MFYGFLQLIPLSFHKTDIKKRNTFCLVCKNNMHDAYYLNRKEELPIFCSNNFITDCIQRHMYGCRYVNTHTWIHTRQHSDFCTWHLNIISKKGKGQWIYGQRTAWIKSICQQGNSLDAQPSMHTYWANAF